MRYALMICTDESAVATEAQEAAMSKAMYEFSSEQGAAGVIVGGERLRPTSASTTVTVRSGDVVVADGPFAETKEQIGGFFIVDCKDLDHAIEIASKVPTAQYGTIEIRPIWEM